jgi:hypothetical protein
MWRITENDKERLREITPLIRSEDYSLEEKAQILFKNLRPCLGWALTILQSMDLEYGEAYSELYIMIYELLENYSPAKGKLISYLGVQLPWAISKKAKEFKKYKRLEILESNGEEETYCLPEEIYLYAKIPVTEDRWLFNSLQKNHKYLIVKILASDEDVKLIELAADIGIGRTKLFELLLELREELKERGFK